MNNLDCLIDKYIKDIFYYTYDIKHAKHSFKKRLLNAKEYRRSVDGFAEKVASSNLKWLDQLSKIKATKAQVRTKTLISKQAIIVEKDRFLFITAIAWFATILFGVGPWVLLDKDPYFSALSFFIIMTAAMFVTIERLSSMSIIHRHSCIIALLEAYDDNYQ